MSHICYPCIGYKKTIKLQSLPHPVTRTGTAGDFPINFGKISGDVLETGRTMWNIVE